MARSKRRTAAYAIPKRRVRPGQARQDACPVRAMALAFLLLFGVPVFLDAAIAQEVGDTTSVVLTVMAFNIRHGEGADGQVDLERVARVIRAHAPDLVALQEVDRHTRRAPEDQVERLAELTGMHGAFGYTLTYQGGDYGIAVLSRRPIDSVHTVDLPGLPDRYEPRAALAVDVHVPRGADDSTAVTFISTHFDVRSSSRLASLPLLETFVAARPDRPYILAGDLNADPDAPTLTTLTETWTNTAAGSPRPTYPAHDPDRQIDYVLVRPADRWTVEAVEVVDAPETSDHRPVVARVRLRGSGVVP